MSTKALIHLENKITEVSNHIDKTTGKRKFNMLLIVVPSGLQMHYKKIKRVCLVKNKIQSQLILESSFENSKTNVMIFGKILLQMLAKLGNILWMPKQISLEGINVVIIAFEATQANTETILCTCGTNDGSYIPKYSKVNQCGIKDRN